MSLSASTCPSGRGRRGLCGLEPWLMPARRPDPCAARETQGPGRGQCRSGGCWSGGCRHRVGDTGNQRQGASRREEDSQEMWSRLHSLHEAASSPGPDRRSRDWAQEEEAGQRHRGEGVLSQCLEDTGFCRKFRLEHNLKEEKRNGCVGRAVQGYSFLPSPSPHTTIPRSPSLKLATTCGVREPWILGRLLSGCKTSGSYLIICGSVSLHVHSDNYIF